MAEGAPLLREYAVYPASRVRIPPSPPIAAFAALALLAPLPLAAATPHPETTQEEKPATPAEAVKIRVLDKVKGHQMVMEFPVGVAVPLPGGVYRARVERYTEDFALHRVPKGTPSGTDEEPSRNSEPPANGGPEGEKPAPEAEADEPDPIPRDEGEDNPAVFIQVFRGEDPISATWVFQDTPHLFQPTNLRYTFVPLGAQSPEEKESARSSAG